MGEHDVTIKTIQSDMVKMSSTFKQDSYLKRKEIAQMKQKNAEYALKLRALEKALKSVNATQKGLNFYGHTMHGSGRGTPLNQLNSESRHGKSMHSVDSLSSRDDKAAAVKARLGGLTPYNFPSMNQLQLKDSQIVTDSNF